MLRVLSRWQGPRFRGVPPSDCPQKWQPSHTVSQCHTALSQDSSISLSLGDLGLPRLHDTRHETGSKLLRSENHSPLWSRLLELSERKM